MFSVCVSRVVPQRHKVAPRAVQKTTRVRREVPFRSLHNATSAYRREIDLTISNGSGGEYDDAGQQKRMPVYYAGNQLPVYGGAHTDLASHEEEFVRNFFSVPLLDAWLTEFGRHEVRMRQRRDVHLIGGAPNAQSTMIAKHVWSAWVKEVACELPKYTTLFDVGGYRGWHVRVAFEKWRDHQVAAAAKTKQRPQPQTVFYLNFITLMCDNVMAAEMHVLQPLAYHTTRAPQMTDTYCDVLLNPDNTLVVRDMFQFTHSIYEEKNDTIDAIHVPIMHKHIYRKDTETHGDDMQCMTCRAFHTDSFKK